MKGIFHVDICCVGFCACGILLLWVKGILNEKICAAFCGGGIFLVKGILVCAGLCDGVFLLVLMKGILDESICAGVCGHCA